MKRTLLVAAMAIATSLVLSAPVAHANSISFVANLTGALEVPSSGSPGTGNATVVLDLTAQTMQVNVIFSGLEAGTTASHIHCCLSSPFLTGVSVGVATTLPYFPGFPLGVTSGSYISPLFDLTNPSSYNPAFVTLEGGTAGAEAALLAGIESGKTYLNIHTTAFPGGEIRGFLTPVPEPGSILLVALGLVGLICTRRKLGRNN